MTDPLGFGPGLDKILEKPGEGARLASDFLRLLREPGVWRGRHQRTMGPLPGSMRAGLSRSRAATRYEMVRDVRSGSPFSPGSAAKGTRARLPSGAIRSDVPF